MPRIMTIWLPRWPVQRRLLERPEWRRVPVFVCRRERRGVLTVVSWAWAMQPRTRNRPDGLRAGAGGVAPVVRIPEGMSLAEGMAVLAMAHGSRACHSAEIEHDDPAADKAALEQLARWCRRFSPAVAVEDASPARQECLRQECLHLDVTGTAGFFGGEGPLVRTVVWTLAARGIHARAAIADTPGAAWAAAHHTNEIPQSTVAGGGAGRRHATGPAGACSRRWAVVPPGAQGEWLSMLPVASLRVEPGVAAQLREVGIDTIGGVLRMSRKSLASRCPSQLVGRLAEFAGTLAEPLQSPPMDELPQATHTFDFPVSLRDVSEEAVAAILERLVGACVAPLAARGTGVTALQVRLEKSQAVDPPAVRRLEACAPAVIDVGLFRPSGSAKHLVDLLRLRMARMRMPREIEGITVEVVAAAAATCRQRSLFGEAAEASALQVGLLLDRLSGRLGRGAVFEPRPVADAQPEHGWVAGVPDGRGGGFAGRRSPSPFPAATSFAAAERRPIWMTPQPVPLETVSVVPEGPPVRFRLGTETCQVMKAHGPERIETAWWRGPTVRRDYYVVETATGARYWLFRRLSGRGSAGSRSGGDWFLHGFFA
jgi:protein ImuB